MLRFAQWPTSSCILYYCELSSVSWISCWWPTKISIRKHTHWVPLYRQMFSPHSIPSWIRKQMSLFCYREQFPIDLLWHISSHRGQGLAVTVSPLIMPRHADPVWDEFSRLTIDRDSGRWAKCKKCKREMSRLKYHYDICWAESESSGAEGPMTVLEDLGESVSPWMIIGHGSGILNVHPTQLYQTRFVLTIVVL